MCPRLASIFSSSRSVEITPKHGPVKLTLNLKLKVKFFRNHPNQLKLNDLNPLSQTNPPNPKQLTQLKPTNPNKPNQPSTKIKLTHPNQPTQLKLIKPNVLTEDSRSLFSQIFIAQVEDTITRSLVSELVVPGLYPL